MSNARLSLWLKASTTLLGCRRAFAFLPSRTFATLPTNDRQIRLETQLPPEDIRRSILIRGLPRFVKERDIRNFLKDDEGIKKIMFEKYHNGNTVAIVTCMGTNYATKLAKSLGDNFVIAGQTIRVKVLKVVSVMEQKELTMCILNFPIDTTEEWLFEKLKPNLHGMTSFLIHRPPGKLEHCEVVVQFDTKAHLDMAIRRVRDQHIDFGGVHAFATRERLPGRLPPPYYRLFVPRYEGSISKLRKIFRGYKDVIEGINIAKNKFGHNIAYVTFNGTPNAMRALKQLNGTPLPNGSRLFMRFARIPKAPLPWDNPGLAEAEVREGSTEAKEDDSKQEVPVEVETDDENKAL